MIHVAGVNRAASDEAVETGNVGLAEQLATRSRPPRTHRLRELRPSRTRQPVWARQEQSPRPSCGLPGTLADVLLPNIFGEHGRPAYNSFVATFCHEIAAGRNPWFTRIAKLRCCMHKKPPRSSSVRLVGGTTIRPASWGATSISEIRATISEFHELYATRGDFPDISNGFSRDLFNTYRSLPVPLRLPYPSQSTRRPSRLPSREHASHGGTGQSFASITLPGQMRGNHYHFKKIERFMVVRGEAEIALRRIYDDEVVRFRVSGDAPGFVDMPTMWAHSIRNVGEREVVTVFWADQLHDEQDPDQYPMQVEETA